MGWFGQPTNHNLNKMKFPQSLGKANKKIHGYAFPHSFRNWHLFEKLRRLIMFILHLFTILTLCHKLLNVLSHTLPPLNSFQISIHLCHAQLNRITRAMSLRQQPLDQIINSWNTYSTLIVEHTIRIYSGCLREINYNLCLSTSKYPY